MNKNLTAVRLAAAHQITFRPRIFNKVSGSLIKGKGSYKSLQETHIS
jgi:hypothetical protein